MRCGRILPSKETNRTAGMWSVGSLWLCFGSLNFGSPAVSSRSERAHHSSAVVLLRAGFQKSGPWPVLLLPQNMKAHCLWAWLVHLYRCFSSPFNHAAPVLGTGGHIDNLSGMTNLRFISLFLRRGKPLYLSEERYKLLEKQWKTHAFDHTAKRWVWHKDNLWSCPRAAWCLPLRLLVLVLLWSGGVVDTSV